MAQDTHIAGMVSEAGKGLIIVVNKWDLATPEEDRHHIGRLLDRHYAFAPWAPVLFTSALMGEGVRDVLEMAGATVTTASSAIDAIEAAAAEPSGTHPEVVDATAWFSAAVVANVAGSRICASVSPST